MGNNSNNSVKNIFFPYKDVMFLSFQFVLLCKSVYKDGQVTKKELKRRNIKTHV